MKTAMNPSSLAAYRALTPETLTRFHKQILAAMQPGQLYTRRELEVLASMRSGPVCGRVAELIKAKLLEVAGEKVCGQSGKHVEALRLAAAQGELELC